MNFISKISENEFFATHRCRNGTLSHIDIELTERCNNNCIHCYINQPENDPSIQASELKTIQINEILSQAANMGCLSVRFTGGEPLLRADFSELYIYARRLGMRVALFTNGRLITEELCRLFKRILPGLPIEISVYGMKTDTYEAATAKRGSFGEFWEGITLLRKFNIPFIVKQCLLPSNINEISEFELFAASLPDMKEKPRYGMHFDLRARRDNPKKNKRIKKLRLSPEESLLMLTREPDKYIRHMRQFAAKFMGPPGSQLFNCGAGLSPCVDAFGNAQMCMLLRHPETVYPLDRTWDCSLHPGSELTPLAYAIREFFPQVRRKQASNSQYLRRCAVCFLHGLCEQCPAKSWEEHGTLDTPVEYFCQVAHAQACYLGLIKNGENAWEVVDWAARIDQFVNGVAVGKKNLENQ